MNHAGECREAQMKDSPLQQVPKKPQQGCSLAGAEGYKSCRRSGGSVQKTKEKKSED